MNASQSLAGPGEGSRAPALAAGPTRAAAFLAGARDTIPMLVGAAPFGLIFGTLASAGPLAVWQGQAMSLAVFAGSSQFIALGLAAGHAGLAVIWLTTLIVNLRHMLYAATLLPHLKHLPAGWRWLLGFLLTDEAFAVMAGHYARAMKEGADTRLSHWYYLGSGLSMYLNWQAWTLAGLVFGAAFPRLSDLGLDYAMAATFIAIVTPQCASRPHLGAAVTAGALALVLAGLPYKLGLLAAVAGGVVVGMALTRWMKGEEGKASGYPKAQRESGE
jgi:4-azaleucine resistance transporter AzlC